MGKPINEIADIKVHGLFPTPIGIYTLNREFEKSEIDEINKKLSDLIRNAGNSTSRDNFVLKSRKLQKIKKFCLDSITHYKNEVMLAHKQEFVITQSWLNKASKNEWHHQHEHPNSVFSGVLYIQTRDEDKIHFIDIFKNSWRFETNGCNHYNSRFAWVSAKTGTLILFPSHLTHHVENLKYDGVRISLSFNTFFKHTAGSLYELNYVNIKDINANR